MFKFRNSIILLILLVLAACAPSEPTTESLSTENTPSAITTLPIVPTATAASIIPTAEPIETPTDNQPASPDLDTFISNLETAVTNQDYDHMQGLMSNPIAVGGWRSEWRPYTPSQTIGQFQNASLPSPLSVKFSGLRDDEITELIGQPPSSMFSPDTNIVASLHSSGWGQSTSDDAILFVAEIDGRYTWHAFLYTTGRFADANLPTTSAPAGLIYSIYGQGIYQVQADGQHRQLLDNQTASIPNLKISPDGRYSAYLTEDRQLWLINNASGDQQQIAADYNFSYYLIWGNSNTLFGGVWLTPEEGDGPNNGHIAIINIDDQTVTILDDKRLSSHRPSLSPDGKTVAFDVFPTGPEDTDTSLIYHPDSGLRLFDPTAFTFVNELYDQPYFNPSWSPDGRKIAWQVSNGERVGIQVFDLEAQTAVQLLDWDPARFGALIPSPLWSPDGQWLALEVWANGPSGSGVWLLAADGSSQVYLDPQGTEPYWASEAQLVFGVKVGGGPRLYDLVTEESFKIDLPEGSWALGVTSLSELQAMSDPFSVLETPVMYIMAMQDVTIYDGPDDSYNDIGNIFDGQTAKVTGKSFITGWWRVICPDDTIGNCWVTSDTSFTMPSEG